MVGWHHRLNGHEFERAPGDGEGEESLACCSPWGRKESDTTEQQPTMPVYRVQKNGTDEPMCRAGTEVQMQRLDLCTQGGRLGCTERAALTHAH